MLLIAVAASSQQLEPVLKQLDEPHPYYYREMYFPQLTTGPSAAAWLPDSKTLVYSMAGWLWKQELGSDTAEQLTSGPGYDYQPDCSADGRWVVFATYNKDAIELWSLDLQTRKTHQLTRAGAINLEPRFSPDGKRLAFVSTAYHGHFHIFVADFENGDIKNVQRLTGETRSELPRFYYSQFDLEINPTWSPDGSEILFVSNRGHVYGTGGFWRMNAVPGAEAREIHYEETSWKARPEFSPDGKRIVYASYLGGQWHQLWLMPSQGGDGLPISYGDFDNTNPRWSPDGRKIAFISNRGGNTSLWIQDAIGGAQREIAARERHYLKEMSTLELTVVDPSGNPTPARVFITGADGRAYAPDDAWMHAEDNFVRDERPFESHYFHTTGVSRTALPVQQVTVEVMKGLEYQVEKMQVQLREHQVTTLTIGLRPLDLPSDSQSHWASADLHVHMNYGGLYRNTPQHLVEQEKAENVSLIENLIVNKEVRFPDIAYFSPKLDSASQPDHLLFHSQEFHTNYWGHTALLHLANNLELPGYTAYGRTAAASLFPTNAAIADLAHAQQGLVGYVHPFDFAPDPVKDSTLTHGEPADMALELPVDVALGKVDYIEAAGFSDHRATASVWYRLLNCGFHLPTGAGSDTMANYASLHGPVGLVRVYARVPKGPLEAETFLASLKQGHTFATNAPLLGFTLGGKDIGDELSLPAGENKVKFNAWMRSIVPVDHLDIICNGEVMRSLKLNPTRDSADVQDTIPVSRSGWCLLRALSDQAEHPVLDIYPYATTSPIYVNVAGSPLKATADAAYFVAWIERLEQAAGGNHDWNDDAEKEEVLKTLDAAKSVYKNLQ